MAATADEAAGPDRPPDDAASLRVQDLRADGRASRRAVVGAERARAERALGSHLASLAIPADSLIGVYVSDDGEPSLDSAVAAFRAQGHSVALPVPANDADDFTMEFRVWEADDTLVDGRFGIPCPPERQTVVPSIVLVPLVRFDAAGNRMGRGAGFYDRWLGRHGAHAIGTAFEVQHCDALLAQPHDVPMHAIVTELGIRFVRPIGDS